MAFEIMKPVDELIDNQVSHLKQSPGYLSFLEDFSNKDENLQNFYKIIIAFGVFLIPIGLCLISFFYHMSVQSKLDNTEEIIATGMRIIEKKSTLSTETRKFFGTPLSSRAALQNSLNSALQSAGVDANKITIKSFSPDSEKGYNVVTIDLKFGGLSNIDLFSFLRNLNTRNKMRVQEIDIKKNIQSNFLEGVITFIHYSKSATPSL